MTTVMIAASLMLLPRCSKVENSDRSLKEAMSAGAAELGTAMEAISSTDAFKLFTLSAGDVKSDASAADYKVYIPLEKISGVYEYSPASTTDRWGISLIRFFKRTADNSSMIVKMPLKKVEQPRLLRLMQQTDSDLANNFEIAVSEYYNNYNGFHDFDYLLNSEITIDQEKAGKLYIKSFLSPDEGRKYDSHYEFANGYTAGYSYESADSAVYSFAVSKDKDTLYSEKRIAVKSDSSPFRREHYYILTVGDVKIVKKLADKTTEIYVNNVLQTNAKVEIVDAEQDDDASVCRKRDLLITFDDGSTANLSALISDSVENIRSLFSSLREVYFAAYVVDWIAYDIYYQRN